MSARLHRPRLLLTVVFIPLLVGCQVPLGLPDQMRSFPGVGEARRIAPRDAWRAIFPELSACVHSLPDRAEVTYNGQPTGTTHDMPTVRRDTRFSDFTWWTASVTTLGSSAEMYDHRHILIRADVLRSPMANQLKAVVHEMSHRYVPESYKNTHGDWGHSHVIFDRCTAVRLRPDLYPSFSPP